jgi:glycosyltransferase involved in cell wall biosynthesis
LGGGQTYVLNLLKFLPEQLAAEVCVLAPASLSLPTEKENIKRIPVGWPVADPFIRAAWERHHLPQLIRQLGANVLFCPGGIIGSSVPLGCKSVTTFQNMLPFDPERRRQYPVGYMRARHWILEKLLLRSMLRSDLVIFISEFARRVVEERARCHISNAVVIPHGISDSFRSGEATASKRPEWLPKEDYLLYVSNIDFYKAQIEVVRAYAQLKRLRPTREKLVFVGAESSAYGRMVREEIRRNNLDGDVVWAGKIPYERMPVIYRHALVNVFASECENCPNILLEALAAGRPLFSSNCPPMPEFAGDAAIYFNPKSPDQLARKLAAVLTDTTSMKTLAVRAKARSRLYDWASSAQMTWQAIQQLAKA